MSVQHPHHGIDYIEFNVTDMDKTKSFYGQAFDWTFTDYAPVYCGIIKPDGGEYGGFNLVDEVVPGGPLVILYSENLALSMEKVVQAGGSLVDEIFEFPGGRRFSFKDPSGNVLAVWSDK